MCCLWYDGVSDSDFESAIEILVQIQMIGRSILSSNCSKDGNGSEEDDAAMATTITSTAVAKSKI